MKYSFPWQTVLGRVLLTSLQANMRKNKQTVPHEVRSQQKGNQNVKIHNFRTV